MDNVNILIIGAGVVGLSVAKALSVEFEDVVLVEKEKTFGRHTSSRNSEVIHSGIYYPQESLKAKLCVQGCDMLYNFAREYGIQFNNCGKLIVATSEKEISELYRLKENGEKNGVKNLRILEKEECNDLEPQINALKALRVESTGIIDTHKLMAKLESKAEENDVFMVYGMEVTTIKKTDNSYIVHFANGEVYQANIVINCAGLHSDTIAQMVGLNIEENKLKLQLCKGEYYKNNHITNIKQLIYPVPDPDGIFLGIHLTINLNNEVRFGPNAYYVDEVDYKMDENYKHDFYEAINRYMDVSINSLHLDDCGIRPKLQGARDEVRDFYIQDESEKGFPGFINLIGIESPGLTSCLSIAEEVKKIIIRSTNVQNQ